MSKCFPANVTQFFSTDGNSRSMEINRTRYLQATKMNNITHWIYIFTKPSHIRVELFVDFTMCLRNGAEEEILPENPGFTLVSSRVSTWIILPLSF